ncbi:MAG: arsenite efflux transporter metallochaperone ArsD [Anaerolineae bacterium]
MNQGDSQRNAGGNGAVVEIFDPPYCCPTGLCGPTLDQTLVDVNEALLALQVRGVRVERYQMATSPQAFTSNAEVMRLVRERQLAALPITMVNKKLLRSGAYPQIDEIEAVLNGGN